MLALSLIHLSATVAAAQLQTTPPVAELRDGNSATRLSALRKTLTDKNLLQSPPAELLDAAIAASKDSNPRVREEVARLVGLGWVRDHPNPPGDAIAVGLTLRNDSEWDVRHNAIYFILADANPKSDSVIDALLDSAIVEANVDDVRKIAAGLKSENPDRLKPFFSHYWDNAARQPEHARRAAKLWQEVTGQDGPAVAAGTEYVHAFKNLYTHLGKTYPCFDMKQIDWKKVGDELLPQANAIQSDDDFGRLCMQLVARLQDSHAYLVPAKAKLPTIEFPRYQAGFSCLVDDRDRVVVYDVVKNSPADEARVQIGMTVLAINDKPVSDAMNAWSAHARKWSGYSSERVLRYDAARAFSSQPGKGDPIKLEVETIGGQMKTIEMTATLDAPYAPRLPVPIPGINDNGLVEAKKLDDRTGYIYVRRIRGELPDQLDDALNKLGQIDKLVIDVRGNSGGGFDAGESFRSFDPKPTADSKGPRFTGPIALILDERCISAGEGWSSWFIATKRARTFGSTTAGASSRKQEYTTTNGLYKVIVPVKAYTGSLDRPIERRGLEPDVPVRCSAIDLANGTDTVLKIARQWLDEQVR